MESQFSRSELLLGKKSTSVLSKKSIAVFGLGGVGGSAVEALVRSGIGTITVIDSDKICVTNINRQLFATHKTVGEYKTNMAEKRILEINPSCKVVKYTQFYNSDNLIDLSNFDYIIDAIDTVSSKLELIVNAKMLNIPIISAMGAGNKLDPTGFKVADIFSTKGCPLAKVMRSGLRTRGIESLKVVYSEEEPAIRHRPPGSVSFVPPVVGLVLAGEVVRELNVR